MYIVTLLDPFTGKSVTVDTNNRQFDHTPGSILCHACPFIGVPLRIEIEICPDGSITHRGWKWDGSANHYLQLMISEAGLFAPTQEQIETVSGMFSGRIMVDGVNLTPGKTVQDICPINLSAEEARVGHKIMLV